MSVGYRGRGEAPTGSIKSIAERAIASQATASKWAKVIRAEAAAGQQQLAQ